MKPSTAAPGLLAAWCLFVSQPAVAQTGPAELAGATARLTSSPQRASSFSAFLATLEEHPAGSVDQRLHFAWTGFLLAETDAERARVLSLAATIPDARARMLIGSFREFPALRRAYASAEASHSRLIALPAEPAGKKRPPRELYGPNPYDAPYTADQWTDPHGAVGRWKDDHLTLDLLAYPANNLLGLIHLSGGGRTRLVGRFWNGSLGLIGAGVTARLDHDRLVVTMAGRTHTLVRTPVGVTSFDQRPAGARVLLDASTGLRHFRHAKTDAGWRQLPGGEIEIEPSKGSLFTREAFGDLHGYLEFRHAYNSESLGPRRGNSGLYLFNTYEVQLVDSFGLPPNETSAGSVYHIAAPQVNASAPPLEWQSFEFRFRAPRFDAAGRKTTNARLTLWFNGVKVHDDLEIPNPTAGSVAGGQALQDPAPPQPMMLQSHGNLVQFRHIWVLPLKD